MGTENEKEFALLSVGAGFLASRRFNPVPWLFFVCFRVHNRLDRPEIRATHPIDFVLGTLSPFKIRVTEVTRAVWDDILVISHQTPLPTISQIMNVFLIIQIYSFAFWSDHTLRSKAVRSQIQYALMVVH
jgi:hypothetical protein